MRQLAVGRALDRELFAFVELGSDHYAQGFADGVQFVTGCTFGKDLIVRIPHGKASLRLVDQEKGRAIRVALRPEAIEGVEQSNWFRTCSSTGRFASETDRAANPLIAEIVAVPEETLFAVGPVFPLRIEHPDPTFESIRCDGCGESVLTTYVRKVDGRHLCVACEERQRVKTR
ncbi:fmdE, Molybdenum formylmethanofuran dehydrogenase operon [Anaeromyxobacter sp. PSR-1]|nr:fmdE, Molybdenum formylmethanofuran dehydrogenase operon [Anaeromyxobacter sp. PSR-1]